MFGLVATLPSYQQTTPHTENTSCTSKPRAVELLVGRWLPGSVNQILCINSCLVRFVFIQNVSTPRGDRPICSVPLSGTYPTEPENAERDDVSPLPVRASANRDIRKGFWWTAFDVSNYGRQAYYEDGSPTGLARARGARKRLRSCKV